MAERALLFTDVVDSTRLVERLGDARAATVWAAHDRRARDLLALHRGREIGRADGLFLMFDTAVDAARFALAYHDAIADLELPARVGIHFGPVKLRENTPADISRGAVRTEVDGLATSLTARLMGLARGGQTLLSARALASLGDAMPPGSESRRHGHYRLKGIETPVEVFELGRGGVSPFAPPPDADKAYRVVRDGDAWRPVREVRHSLPAERDEFVGREDALRDFARRLDGGARLLTVVGTGGMGKTRFVRRYGRAWLGDWPGGVYFADLSDARSQDGIHFAVASALQVPVTREDPGVQLGHAIAGRGRCLVILDNFEQVVAHAPATVGRWLERAPDASFIVTSRERLHLAGEEVVPIEPLPLADDAVELFAARARAQRPDFILSDANRADVAEVVALLDGLPLAIELAAARVRILSPAQIVLRMRDRFALLAGARGPEARQSTLRAAIDWSWDLLTPWEQSAFAQCSTFEGGFTLEAAERVLDVVGWPDAPPVMDVVQALADKSLLRTWIPVAAGRYEIDEPYFGMYLSIHEYAATRLDAVGPHAKHEAQARHGRYFAGFGTDAALDALSRSGGVRRRQALALELRNLVAACRRACLRADATCAVATYRAAWEVLTMRGPIQFAVTLGEQVAALTGASVGERLSASATLAKALRRTGRIDEALAQYDVALALAADEAQPLRIGRLQLGVGNLHRERGKGALARTCYDAALASARVAGDRATQASALGGLGLLAREHGQIDDARGYFNEAIAIARADGDRAEEAILLGSLGLLESECNAVDAARIQLQAALALAQDVGDLGLEGAVRANLGQLDTELGNLDDARTQMEAALAIHRRVGNRRLEAIALGNLGPLCMHQGRADDAHACYVGALAIAREIGNRRHEGFLRLALGILRHSQDRLQDAGDDYAAALDIAREVDDRRGQGLALSRLGELHAEQGRATEARACLDLALESARQGGYRRLEGVVLAGIGRVLSSEGRAPEALAAVRAGEAALRDVQDREELVKVLCLRGTLDSASGDPDAARAALAEATALATAMGAVSSPELARDLERLRRTLG